MSLDVQRLSPTDAARVLNSTPLGTVTTGRQFRELRLRMGYRIGDKTVNLPRLAAHLAIERHRPKAETVAAPPGYAAHMERARRRQADLSKSGRDIGEIPPVKNPERRAEGTESLRRFLEIYHRDVFYLPWSDDHLLLIERLEHCIRNGGNQAVGLQRGFGKSGICRGAVEWCGLNGLIDFALVIGATETHAKDNLANIIRSIETNDLLLEDYPEACYPIRCLDGIGQRAKGQLSQGRRTHITYPGNELVLPWIPGAKSSCFTIRPAGLLGAIRGHSFMRPDGKLVRPGLAIADDPQTRESARSLSQNDLRERIIKDDVLFAGAPGKRFAAVVPCTVIYRNDMVDRILDRKLNPGWRGIRRKFLLSWPADMKLWERYAAKYRDDLAAGDFATSNAFYAKRREAMDQGAEVSWPQRFDVPHEQSGLQHAMNRWFENPYGFMAEYQNEPPDDSAATITLTPEDIIQKASGLKRGIVPQAATIVTAMIDVQMNCLFWKIIGVSEAFTGGIVNYGTWPAQRRTIYTKSDLQVTLERKFPRMGVEGRILAALKACVAECIVPALRREDGADMRVTRCLIDANWGRSTDIVYQFCRQSAHSAILMPSHGRGVGASHKPMTDYKRKPGERLGLHWFVPAIKGKRLARHVIFDANFWKSFVHGRLSTAQGDEGCLSIFGKPEAHRLLAEHLTAEYAVTTEGRGRVVEEWQVKPHRPDNDWLDTLVGACVAASMEGATLPGTEHTEKAAKRKRVSFAELQRKRRV